MRRSGISIMWSLIKLVKPLAHIMLFTITMGVLGFISAIGITVLGGIAIAAAMGFDTGMSLSTALWLAAGCAVVRGLLRYFEQYTGHYIAFKLLALLRDMVFKQLRRLAPAKMEGRSRGELVSMITTDIEMLEVFYAHTIAPVFIAILTSIIMLILLGSIHIAFAAIAAIGYLCVGFILPIFATRAGNEAGMNYRNEAAVMNAFVHDSLKGLRELQMFNLGEKRAEQLKARGTQLNTQMKIMKKQEGLLAGLSDVAVLGFTLLTLLLGLIFVQKGLITVGGLWIAVIIVASSFGPLVALSNLANNLFHTLASGERVLQLLEEDPIVEEVVEGKTAEAGDIQFHDMTFRYHERDQEPVLQHIQATWSQRKIIGIAGSSGSGKSTLLKLIMRFWQPQEGRISWNGTDIQEIETRSLRNHQTYVTQDTFLFRDTIGENIRISRPEATQAEVEEAARKASIHEWIMSLPHGYETEVGDAGERLSGGERQRIGLARAFLHDSSLLILDEPTSNLDSLNEKVILRALTEWREDKTILLVSHRPSTIQIADEQYTVSKGELLPAESQN